MPYKKRFFLFIFIFATSSSAFSQTSHVNSLRNQFITFHSGYSPNSVRLIGKTPDSRTFHFYIGYGKHIKELNHEFNVYYTAGVIPYIEFDYLKRDDGYARDITNGFGISPVGFMFLKKLAPRLNLALNTSGSIIYMDKFFPTDKGRRLNYTFDLSAALQPVVGEHFGFSLGYKFHHISNAQTGKENPGLDSNLFFLSILFFN